MPELVNWRARSSLMLVLLGFVACGITERHVEERSETGAASAMGHGGQPHGGFVTGGVGIVAGFGSPPGSGGTAFAGMPAGGMASGGRPPLVECPEVPPIEPSCPPEAQGGAGGESTAWCSVPMAEGGAPNGGAGGDAATGGSPPEPDPPSGSLIDDFEDGDETSFPVLGGQGFWFVVNDGSGQQFPAPCTLPSLLSELERGSQRAMRTYGQGFSGQPGGFSLIGLSMRRGAPACDQSLDASAFDGVEFWARGSGTVRFSIGTVATHPVVDAGTCPVNCYDAHGTSVTLGATWQRYRIPFDQLIQEGWGYPTGFDRSKILGLQWSAKVAPFNPTPSPCFDFWIDDVAFFAD